MAQCPSLDTDLSRRFFAPAADLYPQSLRQYRCTGISDIHYIQLGVLRCLSSATSGQQFLQNHADEDMANIDPGHFFKALASPRRLINLTSCNDLLAGKMARSIDDPFLQCPELHGWHIYAVDGHYQKSACFDPKSANAKGDITSVATGHFFRLNLRTHHMSYLDSAHAAGGKKKAHDITVIKRQDAAGLRYGAENGTKVMLVWDKACIDYQLWHRLKHSHGIYFITLEKSGSAAEICSNDMLDRADPRNEGVDSDHLVGTSNGVQLRRIVYTNPEDGANYIYLTNDFTLPACQLVLLYKHRWDIEKIFHQFKSKMNERKSWASSAEAKKSHAIFECIAHNLLLLFEDEITREEGIRDEAEERKREGRQKSRPGAAGLMGKLRNFINSALTRATQRTQRFIRWVRARIYKRVPWSESIARLRELWGVTT